MTAIIEGAVIMGGVRGGLLPVMKLSVWLDDVHQAVRLFICNLLFVIQIKKCCNIPVNIYKKAKKNVT